MSDIKNITSNLDRLDEQLDDLDDALMPLLNGLDAKASQLPLLDRAKLFSLSAYAIETLLFCESHSLICFMLAENVAYLRLEGVDAQNHAVFTELKHVQQYFAKIKAADQPEAKRTLTLNQEAAARLLRVDLSDKTLKNKLAEKIAEERAKALLKSVESKKRPAPDHAAPPPGASSVEKQADSRKKSRQEKKEKTMTKKH